jgi:hypothetical protein
MHADLSGVENKLERAVTHINNLREQIASFRNSEPYSVRKQEDSDKGRRVCRLVAVKNPNVGPPDVGMVLLAGEAAYQLRSALDHVVHQLVAVNGNAALLKDSRSHQFPIFKSPHGYGARACGMIYGVSKDVADIIEQSQPYKVRPGAPEYDALWILQDLNNTDKHPLIPVAVIGLDVVSASDTRGELFTLASNDVVLEDNQVFFTFFNDTERYDDIRLKLRCAVAFEQAMRMWDSTVSMDVMLLDIAERVDSVIGLFRPLFK